MQAKKISLKKVTLKISTGTFPYIGKYVPGVLKESDLPKPVILVDEDSGSEHLCQLQLVIPFKDIIPEAFSWLAEGLPPEDCIDQLLERNKVQSVNQLAFYLYVR